jgi:putative radical SAM enzyme (TIGR03279 family)
MRYGVRVQHVEPDGLAAQQGIKKGDLLLSINNHPVRDTLDVFYFTARKRLRIKVKCRTGSLKVISIQKRSEEYPLGLTAEPLKIRRCRNRCIFCFVHQLPPNLRSALYIKDEDYRLSFLHGNYITATDLTEADFNRIVRQRLSPLYISVHSTDPSLRRKLLGRTQAPDILPALCRLRSHSISFHSQIVLCPGLNNGAHLQRTISDLVHFYPFLLSIAIVPVGLTKYRNPTHRLTRVTPAYARRFLPQLEHVARRLTRRLGRRILFLSDEFYLLAGRKPPQYHELDVVPQLENGVGMVWQFYERYRSAIRSLPHALPRQRRVGVITSKLGEIVLRRVIARLNRIRKLQVNPLVVSNRLFGSTVTVTGLLAGKDILRAIRRHPAYDVYLIPANCLRPEDNMFLDNISLSELSAATKSFVRVVPNDARAFIAEVLGVPDGR